MYMKNQESEITKTWNFNISKISEEDKIACLKIYHGEDWYNSHINTHKADIENEESFAFMELNALFVNDLIHPGEEPVTFSNNEVKKLLTVFVYHDLKLSDRIKQYYLEVEGESAFDLVSRNENEKVMQIMRKYNFWVNSNLSS